MGHKPLPDYFHKKQWQKILAQISHIAKFAKQTGFTGIALDTESYNKLIWNSAKRPLNKYSLKKLKKIIYKRGQEIMQAIIKEFPNAEIFVFQRLRYPSTLVLL